MVLGNGYTNTHNWPYTYSSFKNGKAIDELFRKTYLLNKNKINIDDPFNYNEYPISFKLKYIAIFYIHIVEKFLNIIKRYFL